jgi:hypothetical protein
VTGRGNERREVFRGDEDWRLFLSTLGRTVSRWRWVVHAYCLMGRKLQMDERPGMWIGSEGFGKRLQALARGKKDILDHPRRQRRTSRRELSGYFPIDGCEDRAARDESIFRAYVEGRFTQREIGDYLGLHYVTVSCIVWAKEKENRFDKDLDQGH